MGQIQRIHIQAAISPVEMHSKNEIHMNGEVKAYVQWAVLHRTIKQYCSVYLFSVFHLLNAIGSDSIFVLLLFFLY